MASVQYRKMEGLKSVNLIIQTIAEMIADNELYFKYCTELFSMGIQVRRTAVQ